MTPEQEKAIADFAGWANEERRNGVTLTALYEAQRRLSDDFLAHVAEDKQRFDKQEQRWGRLRKWREEVRSSIGVRATMPTLNPDDSGSIDISIQIGRAHV